MKMQLLVLLQITLSFLSNLTADTTAPATDKEFVVFTQPKTGTFLLTKLLTKLTHRNQHFVGFNFYPCFPFPLPAKSEPEFVECLNKIGYVPVYRHYRTVKNTLYIENLDHIKEISGFFNCHTPYSPQLDQLLQDRDCIVFFIKRDPRNYIVSGARFYADKPYCPFPYPWFSSLSLNDKIMAMITGTEWYNSSRWIVSSFMPWIDSSNCVVLSFEDLVAHGSEEQMDQLRLIKEALNLDVTDEELLDAFHSIWGTGPTYSGKIGCWKEVFTEEHKQACKECIGDLLIELGYETDYDW